MEHANHICGIMVSMLASSAVDHGYEPRSGLTKDCKIGICFFATIIHIFAVNLGHSNYFYRTTNFLQYGCVVMVIVCV
jgi:hypothetical protein